MIYKDGVSYECVVCYCRLIVYASIIGMLLLISGNVEFSDGEKAFWAIDSMGRLSLDADEPGYKPSEEDIEVFQEKLREELKNMQ